jgi:outer membrane cobalamin receptor
MRSFLRLPVIVLFLAACVRQAPADSSSTSAGNVITEAEIAHAQAVTAYDAVQKLRANFFSNRGRTTILGDASPLPVVFLDGMEYGPMSSLQNIPASQVSSIRLYRAWEVSTKFGMGKTGGVIEVTTKVP